MLCYAHQKQTVSAKKEGAAVRIITVVGIRKSGKTSTVTALVEEIRRQLNLTTLKFNKLETLVKAIGLPKCKLCTHCFDGTGCCKH